jgi:hypothetical protein
MIDTPGIYADVPMADYVADPCPEPSLSKGVVKTLIEKSPLHAYHEHPRLGGKPDDGSSRADLGSAAHGALLGGAEKIAFVDADDYRTKAAKQARDEAREAGRIPVLRKLADDLVRMTDSASKALAAMGAADVLSGAEQTMVWKDDGGIWCRARFDYVSPSRMRAIDYKTANNAAPDAWIKTTMVGGGYDLQAAHYLRGLDVLFGEAEREFLFLVQEIEAPFACSVITLGPEHMELARRKWNLGAKLWRKCTKSGEWPGYDSHIHYSEPPTWDVWATEERALRIGEAA